MAHTQVAQLAQTNRKLLELSGKHRAVVGPRNIRQGTEQAVQVQLVGANQGVREQVRDAGMRQLRLRVPHPG